MILSGLVCAVAALEQRGIPVAVLREFETNEPFIEIDLLVASGYRRELTGALVSCGFAPLRAWGHRGHRFYLRYSVDDRRWVKLDFVTGVAGADAELALAGRRRVDGLPRLQPEVERAFLLLHCLVDKQGRLGRHATAVRRLPVEEIAPPPGAPPALRRLWPELERAIAAPSAVLPDALVRRVADVVAPDRARRMRRDRWLRRASYLRRALRPAAATIVVTAEARDGSGRASERLVGELGPGARRLSPPRGRGPLAVVRRRLTVELERRRNDGPVVIDAGLEATGLRHADVTLTAPAKTESEIPAAAPPINEAVWRAYRRRLLR